MAELKENGNGHRQIWWKRALPVVIATALGGLLGGPGFRAIDDPRKHPWTSEQDAVAMVVMKTDIRREQEKDREEIRLIDNSTLARIAAMEVQLEKRLDRMDARCNVLTSAVGKLPPDDLLERVTRVEQQVKYLERFFPATGQKGIRQ